MRRTRPPPARGKDLMASSSPWGNRPWRVDFHAAPRDLPPQVDFAVVGGGFSALAAAAWLRRLAPERSVGLLEARNFGDGASGFTGGVPLAETAAGDLPGLGDVLAGYQRILQELKVDAELTLPGAYELGRTGALPDSPIQWQDSGELRVVKKVPGGTVNPGKVVSGLARAAEASGVLLFEHCEVERAEFGEPIVLHTAKGALKAGSVLFATNAFSLEMTAMTGLAQPAFTLAVATLPLPEATLRAIGLAERKPFYTIDLPYLWGRPLGEAMIFGCGLVFPQHWSELRKLEADGPEAAPLFAKLQSRVRGLHPALAGVEFPRRWGGPIAISEQWKPVFRKHPSGENAILLGAFSGHGVAQSVYLGTWAAEALLGRRDLPDWTLAEAHGGP